MHTQSNAIEFRCTFLKATKLKAIRIFEDILEGAPNQLGASNQSGIQFDFEVPLHAVELCNKHLSYPFKHKTRDLKIKSSHCICLTKQVNKEDSAQSVTKTVLNVLIKDLNKTGLTNRGSCIAVDLALRKHTKTFLSGSSRPSTSDWIVFHWSIWLKEYILSIFCTKTTLCRLRGIFFNQSCVTLH